MVLIKQQQPTYVLIPQFKFIMLEIRLKVAIKKNKNHDQSLIHYLEQLKQNLILENVESDIPFNERVWYFQMLHKCILFLVLNNRKYVNDLLEKIEINVAKPY